MKLTSEAIESRQVQLNIEMEEEEVEQYKDKAYKNLVNRVSVPGFRKGKTPKTILENLIGKDTILQEAIEGMIPEVYNKALEQEKIVAIARPHIELLQTQPVTFKAIVPLLPEVTLGNYKDIRIEYALPEITDADIDGALQQIQQQQSTLVPVERPAEDGDVVTLDISGEEQGEALPLRKDLVYELRQGNALPLPGFAEKVMGIAKGEERSFSLTYADDYENKELAGKNYSFNIKANEIKKRELPEINDELAKTLNSNDLQDLQGKVAAQLKNRNEQRTNAEYENKIFEKLIDISKTEFPPVLSEIEIDGMIEEEAKNFPDGLQGLEKYLVSIGKPMDDHRKELQPIALGRVTRALLLSKIIEAEGVTVDDAELQGEIDKMAGQSQAEGEEFKKLFTLPQTRKSLEQFLIRQKAVLLLSNIAKGNIDK
ncbi:MAG TPA: trigger factor [Dehalococcoidia bacterium]|nr:trigger factor [Dehalococcoidia bacterium]